MRFDTATTPSHVNGQGDWEPRWVPVPAPASSWFEIEFTVTVDEDGIRILALPVDLSIDLLGYGLAHVQKGGTSCPRS